MDLEKLMQSVVAWAEKERGIVGVALVGSHARGAARPDSDVDLMLLSPNPQPYLEDRGWLERFGPVTAVEAEDWGPVTSLRTVYEGGPEVEFGLSTPAWASIPVDAGTRRVVADGLRVLYDPEGVLKRLHLEVTTA